MSETRDSSDWRGQLRLRLEDLIGEFTTHGTTPDQVFNAIVADIAELRDAKDGDTDPARAPEDGAAIIDPANDWPAAE